jgi:hypothetical protein
VKPITEKRRSLRAKSAAIIEAAQQTRNRSIWVVDRARNLVHAIRLKRQVAILERDMDTRRPPVRGRRRGYRPQPGGRRRTDPPSQGTRVAVIPELGLEGSTADDLKQIGKPEDQRINPDRDRELAYWSEKLGVSRDELRKAVQAAGPMVKDVQRHLNR